MGVSVVGVDFVVDGEITELAMRHERGQVLEQAGRAFDCHEQHGLRLPPGHFVPNAYRDVKDQPYSFANEPKLTISLFKIWEFGTITSSFLSERRWVAWSRISITSPIAT